MGHVVLIAGNGREALERIDSEPVDLVLMDVKMPEMDGVEATRRIRSSTSEKSQVPIVAMTAYAMSGDRERLLASGMNDYIAKPIVKEELIEVLRRSLHQ